MLSGELERIGAGYALGSRGAAGDHAMVAALIQLLQDGRNHNARRAAMYGLAAAGDNAVPALIRVIAHQLGEESAAAAHSQNSTRARAIPTTMRLPGAVYRSLFGCGCSHRLCDAR